MENSNKQAGQAGGEKHIKCLVCHKKLRPPTSIPRWDLATQEHNSAYYAEQKVKHQEELNQGRLGMFGESQFCGQACATFYGRAGANLVRAVPEWAVGVEKLLLCYPWVLRLREKSK